MPNLIKARCIPPAICAAAAIASGAQAATTPSQVRVAISPDSSNPAWKTPGVNFEKAVDCYVVKATTLNPSQPAPADVLGTGSARAPLFNPGLPNPDGTYSAKANNGDNTIFVPLNLAVDPKSYVACSGRILANGTTVSPVRRGGATYATIMQIGETGPLTVSPSLDPAKLAAVPQWLRPLMSPRLAMRNPGSGNPGFKDRFDIDSSTMSPNVLPGSDVQIAHTSQAQDSRATIEPLNGVQVSANHIAFAAGAFGQYSLDSCKAQSYRSGQIELVKAAGYICLKTTDGRYSALRLSQEHMSQSSNPAITQPDYAVYIDMVVWK